MVNDKSFKTQMTELISKLKTINSKRKIADQPIISVSDILSWKMSLYKSDNEEVIESFAYLTPKNLKHLETRLLIPNQCSHRFKWANGMHITGTIDYLESQHISISAPEIRLGDIFTGITDEIDLTLEERMILDNTREPDESDAESYFDELEILEVDEDSVDTEVVRDVSPTPFMAQSIVEVPPASSPSTQYLQQTPTNSPPVQLLDQTAPDRIPVSPAPNYENLVLPTAPNSAQSTQNITYPLAGIQAPNNTPNHMSQQLRIVPPGSTQHQQAIPILVNVQPVNWFLYKYVNGNLDTVYYLPFIN